MQSSTVSYRELCLLTFQHCTGVQQPSVFMLVNAEAPPKLRPASHDACCAFADRAPFTFFAKSKAIFHT